MKISTPHQEALYRAWLAYQTYLRGSVARIPLEQVWSAVPGMPWRRAEEIFLEAWSRETSNAIKEQALAANDLLDIPPERKEAMKALLLDNPYSEAYVLRRGAALVAEVLEPTRTAINAVVARGFSEHATVQQVARLLSGYRGRDGVVHKGVVGLLERDLEQCSKYMDMLMQQGFSPKDALDAVSRLADDKLKLRGENIARTEIAYAHDYANRRTWAEARDRGFLPFTTMKRWIATPGERRTCPRCAALHNEVVPVNGAFSNGKDGPPAHSSCRCTTSLWTPTASRPERPAMLTEAELADVAERHARLRSEQARKRARWLANGAPANGARRIKKR